MGLNIFSMQINPSQLSSTGTSYKNIMQKRKFRMNTKVTILALFSLLIVSITGCTKPLPIQPLPTETPTLSCNDTLWNHVYHPSRLQVIEKCKVITGTVINYKDEADGDFHIRLDVDDKSLINQGNIDYQNRYLVVEPICQKQPTQQNAIEPCKDYNGPYFDMGRYINKHVSIVGSYVEDTQHHNWREIHPMNSITIIN